jgi:hypothetical protein
MQQLPQYHMGLMVSLHPLVLLHWLLVGVEVEHFTVLVEEVEVFKSKGLLLRLEQLIALPLVLEALLVQQRIRELVLARPRRLVA